MLRTYKLYFQRMYFQKCIKVYLFVISTNTLKKDQLLNELKSSSSFYMKAQIKQNTNTWSKNETFHVVRPRFTSHLQRTKQN